MGAITGATVVLLCVLGNAEGARVGTRVGERVVDGSVTGRVVGLEELLAMTGAIEEAATGALEGAIEEEATGADGEVQPQPEPEAGTRFQLQQQLLPSGALHPDPGTSGWLTFPETH